MQNAVETCLDRIYFIRTSTMKRALGYGFRYLGFAFPEHQATAIKQAALERIQETEIAWELLLVRLLEDDGAYCLDTTWYKLDPQKLNNLESALEQIFKEENLATDGVFAWVARPVINEAYSLASISEEVEAWFIKDWLTATGDALRKTDFKVTELRAPAINKMLGVK